MNYYNYYTEIEETFVRRRGKNLFLSPIDWALIEVWQERGIPLYIVIRSIESVFDVFDKQPPGTRTIKSLFYCREEIEVQYNEWLKAQTGKSGEAEDETAGSAYSPESVAAHIARSIDTLRGHPAESLREDLDRAADRLAELASNISEDYETVDKTLADIEKLLDRAMLTNWDKQHLKVLEKEVSALLRAHKADMDADSYKKTHELMLLKRLREEVGIPRLGLFYL